MGNTPAIRSWCWLFLWLGGNLLAWAEGESGNAPDPRPPECLYAQLRGGVLGLDASQMGSYADEPVWAVVMDVGFPEGSATLVTAVDGTTSLYFSTGGGMLGTGEFAAVRLASTNLRQIAAQAIKAAALDPAPEQPLPGAEHVAFYVVTDDGVMGAEAAVEALSDPEHPLAALYAQAETVIGEMRGVDARQQGPDPDPPVAAEPAPTPPAT